MVMLKCETWQRKLYSRFPEQTDIGQGAKKNAAFPYGQAAFGRPSKLH